MELKDNPSAKDSLVLWKMDLNFDTLTNGKSHNTGNVLELSNSNLLVCTGFLGRIFEVTRQKKELVWDAFVMTKAPGDSRWVSMSQYRCNWTRSLAYYHFLADAQLSEKSKAKHFLKVIIYNTGNINDLYKINVITPEGKVMFSKVTRLVKSNSFTHVSFPIKMETTLVGNLKVVVVSQNSKATYDELKIKTAK
jgi:hypothetical protein